MWGQLVRGLQAVLDGLAAPEGAVNDHQHKQEEEEQRAQEGQEDLPPGDRTWEQTVSEPTWSFRASQLQHGHVKEEHLKLIM